MSSQKPGWYPDPAGNGGQRYFDGTTWGPIAPPTPAPRKKVPVVLIIMGVLFLTCGGCGALGLIGALGSDSKKDDSSSVSSSPSSRFIAQPTASPTPDPSADDSRDRVFFTQLAAYPWFKTVDRDDLVEKAHLVCTRTAAAGGDSAAKAKVISVMMDSGFSLDNAMGFMLSSFTAYCPEHLALLR